MIARAEVPGVGNDCTTLAWNACSSALAHAGHHHARAPLSHRPGLRSSRLHVFDTVPDPARPRLVKTVEPGELAARAGYSRPHTLHCGPDGVFLSCLGGADGADGPGWRGADGPARASEVLRGWESERGRSTSPTTSGGTSWPRNIGRDQRVGNPFHDRGTVSSPS
ncbi:hypothetical protein GCM10017687_29560 [Streptomyces echinatus]